MNDSSFLNEVISYSLETLKKIEFAPNVDYKFPNDYEVDLTNEVDSKLINKRMKDTEFNDEL